MLFEEMMKTRIGMIDGSLPSNTSYRMAELNATNLKTGKVDEVLLSRILEYKLSRTMNV